MSQFLLDGTVFGFWDWDAAELASYQERLARAGMRNASFGAFRGPGQLTPNTNVMEFATVDQARQHLAAWVRPTYDPDRGIPWLACDEFALTGWTDWEAYAFAGPQRPHGSAGPRVTGFLGLVVNALIDTFLVSAEVGDEVNTGAGITPPGRGDPALAAWSAMAQHLLAPPPAAVRRSCDPAARAVFAPPLQAFADPLADQAAP